MFGHTDKKGKAKIAALAGALAAILVASLLVVVPVLAASSSANGNDHAPVTIVAGTGTFSNQGVPTVAFIPATGCGAGAGTCVATCSGPMLTTDTVPSPTSTPSTSTALFLFAAMESAAITGLITSNTPGTYNANIVVDPCVQPGSGTVAVNTATAFFTFNDVTVNLPDGKSITGGLSVTNEFTTSVVGNPAVLLTSTALGHWTITGTGDLRGVTGIGESASTGKTTPTSSTVAGAYWVQLNIPKGE